MEHGVVFVLIFLLNSMAAAM